MLRDTEEGLRIVCEVPRQVAFTYKRSCWWLDVDDAAQAGAVAVWEALAAVDPTEGDARAYAWRAAVHAIGRMVKKASSPVSGTAEALVGMTRAPLTKPNGDHWPALVVEDMTEEEMLEEERATAIRARLVHLLGEGCAEYALACLGGMCTPAQVARDHGMDIRAVYRLNLKITNILRDDAKLHKLWKDER